MRIALSISTLNRADGLETVLRSLAAQRVEGDRPDLVAVVVNNDPSDTEPRAVADRVGRETGLSIEVHDEPKRGVAPPRNRGIGRAREVAGDDGLIGFIDDDEYAPEGWLEELLRVKRAHGAEIVTGPVHSEFEVPPPKWVIKGGFFERPERATGTTRPWAFTNNVLFDAHLLNRLDTWFDDSFLRLSEDRHFFQRLARSGARIVWAADAPVNEVVPPDRATAGWLVRRLRTVGRCVAPLRRDLDGHLVAVCASLAKSPVWIVIGAATTFAGIVGGMAMRVRGRSWIAYGVGLAEGVFVSRVAGRPASTSD
ncbi:MAG: glycosyltransferase [Phycisphaerales bacterium]|nr:glycosyltransferase [Phycisphaerales bacterium]